MNRLTIFSLALCLAAPGAFAGEAPTEKLARIEKQLEDLRNELAALGGAQGGKKPDGATGKLKPKPKPKTAKIESGPFKVQVTLEGVFEARNMAQVVLRPEAWSSFKVLTAVAQGTRVKQGDVLVRLDPRKIDESIADQQAGRALSDLALNLARENLKLEQLSTPLALTQAKRDSQQADEDLKIFREVDRGRIVESARVSLKASGDLKDLLGQ